MQISMWVAVAAMALSAGLSMAADTPATRPSMPAMPSATSVYDFTMKNIDGQPTPLAQYKGKTLLIVNVASKCGYTKQYAELEKLYEQYKDKGLVILGFPANNFKGQEPGSDEQIKQFCTANYGVTFPMFSKISVKGEDMHPLYQYLTTSATPPGDIGWNFEKFVIAPDGTIVARFKSKVTPESDDVKQAIQTAMAKK